MDNSIVEPEQTNELLCNSNETNEELQKITDPQANIVRYICSRCKKQFMKLRQFKEHMTRKYPCVIEYNTDYFCLKNIIKLRDKYKTIRLYSADDDTIDFDLKYKALVDFYDKVNKLLILIETDRNLTPSITEDMVSELKSYLKNCKTGQFD